jgi:hypothetical protein
MPCVTGLSAAVLGLLLAGCGIAGQHSDRLLIFGEENFSDQPYSRHARELSFPLPGAAAGSLLPPCQATYSELRLRPPFEVRVGPGRLEDTGDGSDLPVILTDADFPEDGTAWWIVIERDGAVAIRPVAEGEEPNDPRMLC